jgi:futalosine hydrolase
VPLLVVTAVAAERDAILDALPQAEVLVAGIGAAAAAAATAATLAASSFDVVISAGIAGGFDVPVGAVVVASRTVHADLGIRTADGFEPIGTTSFDVRPDLVQQLTARTGALTGAVLTVSTVTGTASGAAEVRARHPDAVAEAMEGFGVATAAARHGVAFAEVRAISNRVGPRDRQSWRIPEALGALTQAFATIMKERLR